MCQPVKSINTNFTQVRSYFGRGSHELSTCAVPHRLNWATVWEEKLLSSVLSPGEAIAAVESSCQLASVNFYLSTPLPFSSFFFRSQYEPSFTSSAHLSGYLSLSPSSSPFSCVCRSVCLYTLTLSSLPSQHCSSWLPGSQPPLSIPHSSHSSPLNRARWVMRGRESERQCEEEHRWREEGDVKKRGRWDGWKKEKKKVKRRQ